MRRRSVLRVRVAAAVDTAVAAVVAAAEVVVADTEIVNPDGVRDTQRRRGTTIRNIKEKAGSSPGFFYFTPV